MLRIGCRALLLVAIAILHPAAALASDGAIEINAAKAAAGGVTPGDTPGFPITLDTPGSYRLTGDLAVGDPDTGAISITSADVPLVCHRRPLLGLASRLVRRGLIGAGQSGSA
jgi:hypothetical protein